jgi:predicted MPP superfamily phosphohydrolase
MILLPVLILTEIFSLVVIRQHFFTRSRYAYYLSLIAHVILSIWLWILFIGIISHRSFFDTPDHVWMLTAFTGVIAAVVIPRLIVIILHFTGKVIRRRSGGHIRWLTNSAMILYAFVIVIILLSTFHGKYNFKYENVPIKMDDLPESLDGLKIVQISDLHLAGFYHARGRLIKVIRNINLIKPDLIINTGDFITFGWRESGGYDTILAKAVSRYGNFAIMGNHDAGTYNPEFSEAEKTNNVLVIKNFIKASGYTVLNDSNALVMIGNSKLGIIGVTSKGRFPEIIHGNIDKAVEGLDSADFRIFLTHDPNHWLTAVAGKRPEMNLTMSGHTHGMQMGIMTRRLKWSPSKYWYPNWNGVYRNGKQVHYVNRGLGVLGIPFRIWMPPEITIITLTKN